MGEDRSPVLVVESDRAERERLGRWIGDAGYEVWYCPGPGAPTYTCVGGRGGRCALAAGADAIVLDLWLESDGVPEGTGGRDLFSYYRGLGTPVVALAGQGDARGFSDGEQVRVLDGSPARTDLLRALFELLGGESRGDDLAG